MRPDLTRLAIATVTAFLTDMSARRVVNLREMQRIAGREQRVALTLMPGSKVLLANNFILMSGGELDQFLGDCGVPTKDKKTWGAAQLQLSLGLWWNSVQFTLWLAQEKVERYTESLLSYAVG